MKLHVMITAVLCLFSLSIWSHEPEQKSEKPKRYVPEEGDFAIGIDATPIFEYLGNAFNGYGTNGTPNTLRTFGSSFIFANNPYMPTVAISGKYLFRDDIAFRAKIGFLSRVTESSFFVQDDKSVALNPLSEKQLADRSTTSRNGGMIALGAEYRKGERRVQGIFGGDILFGYKTESTTYTFGNSITDINQQPTTYAFSYPGVYTGYRPLNFNNTNVFTFGVVLHAGVEFFVAPKISIGGEVNLALYGDFATQRNTTSEQWNSIRQEVEQITDYVEPGWSNLTFGTGNFGASLFVMFYF